MRLELVEEDFEDALTAADVQRMLRPGTRHLSETKETTLFELLPKVVAHKLRKHLPDEFELQEIEVTAELAGKVFGCGLSGNLTVRFSRD